MSDFPVHQKLLDDCIVLGELALSKVLLMNDSRYSWLILVPRIDNLRDLHDLPRSHWLDLFDEVNTASLAVAKFCNAHKVNVAALGNQVPQLHIHVIGRTVDDEAWPGPVWGVGEARPYAIDQETEAVAHFKSALSI